MNVRELIEALNQYDGDLNVITEGCDCIGDAGHLEMSFGEVMICRGGVEPSTTPPPAPVDEHDQKWLREQAALGRQIGL